MAEELHPSTPEPRANPDSPAPPRRLSRIFQRVLSPALRTDYRVADFGAAIGAFLTAALGIVLVSYFVFRGDVPETYLGKMPVSGLLPGLGGMAGIVLGALFGALAMHMLS